MWFHPLFAHRVPEGGGGGTGRGIGGDGHEDALVGVGVEAGAGDGVTQLGGIGRFLWLCPDLGG